MDKQSIARILRDGEDAYRCAADGLVDREAGSMIGIELYRRFNDPKADREAPEIVVNKLAGAVDAAIKAGYITIPEDHKWNGLLCWLKSQHPDRYEDDRITAEQSLHDRWLFIQQRSIYRNIATAYGLLAEMVEAAKRQTRLGRLTAADKKLIDLSKLGLRGNDLAIKTGRKTAGAARAALCRAKKKVKKGK